MLLRWNLSSRSSVTSWLELLTRIFGSTLGSPSAPPPSGPPRARSPRRPRPLGPPRARFPRRPGLPRGAQGRRPGGPGARLRAAPEEPGHPLAQARSLAAGSSLGPRAAAQRGPELAGLPAPTAPPAWRAKGPGTPRPSPALPPALPGPLAPPAPPPHSPSHPFRTSAALPHHSPP